MYAPLYKGEEKWEFGGSAEKVYVFCGEFRVLKDPESFWNVLRKGKVRFPKGDMWDGCFRNFEWKGEKDGWVCDFAGFEAEGDEDVGDVGKAVIHRCLVTDSDLLVL